MIEELAKYGHENWSKWMEELLNVSSVNGDGTITIPITLTNKFVRQMCTDYDNLPFVEKEAYKDVARDVIKIIEDVMDGV